MVDSKTRFREVAVDRFGWVLLASMVTYIILVAVDQSEWAGISGTLPVLLTVLLTINASSPGPKARYFAVSLVGGAVIVGAISADVHDARVYGIAMLLAGFSLGVCIVLTLLRMAEHTRVSVQTVLAVLAAYVMFGLFFTFIDSGVGHITGQFFYQSGAHTQSDYAYLSYITLTTVGFGDLTPGTGIARSLIILEALMGQIFLVTLVARMVSLLGTERAPMSARRAEGLEEDTNPSE